MRIASFHRRACFGQLVGVLRVSRGTVDMVLLNARFFTFPNHHLLRCAGAFSSSSSENAGSNPYSAFLLKQQPEPTYTGPWMPSRHFMSI